jgi:hypothetical protein
LPDSSVPIRPGSDGKSSFSVTLPVLLSPPLPYLF